MSTQRRRNTKQRQIILEELRKVDTHPTADEVYEMVRQRLPRVSLGTVYRNLDNLEKTGQIRRAGLGINQKRFDGNANDHYHMRCLHCNGVYDTPAVSEDLIKSAIQEVSDSTGFIIIGHQVEFTGTCPRCQKNKPANEDS